MGQPRVKAKVSTTGQMGFGYVPGPKLIERESSLQERIRLAVSAAGVLLFRNNVGLASYKGQKVRYGLGKGSADLVGVAGPHGRFIALEIKRAKGGKVSRDQERWLKWVRLYGGVSGVVRSVDEALKLVEEARQPVGWA